MNIRKKLMLSKKDLYQMVKVQLLIWLCFVLLMTISIYFRELKEPKKEIWNKTIDWLTMNIESVNSNKWSVNQWIEFLHLKKGVIIFSNNSIIRLIFRICTMNCWKKQTLTIWKHWRLVLSDWTNWSMT